MLKMSKIAQKTFLFWIRSEVYLGLDFALSEISSLFTHFKLDLKPFNEKVMEGPFLLMNFDSAEPINKILSRSIYTHSCYELWSDSSQLDNLHNKLKKKIEEDETFLAPIIDKSFKINIHSFGKVINHEGKLKLIDEFTYLNLEGKIDLKNPEMSLHLLQYHNDPKGDPVHNYFGVLIGNGQRRKVHQMNLTDRKFIGNTSMDPSLSLLMCNLALVKENQLVFDPFVGSGSILAAAAMLGGHVFGADIDYLMIHALRKPSRKNQKKREEDESVRANLEQYGLLSKYLDVLISDFSIADSLYRDSLLFDSIVTDPPYGIRESKEKIGSTKENCLIKIVGEHYPQKINYSFSDILVDLIDFSAKRLKLGGRLVFWIPTLRKSFDEEKLPKNPILKLVSYSEQILTASTCRFLVVYEKIKEFEAEENSTKKSLTEIDANAPFYQLKIFKRDPNAIPAKDVTRSKIF